MGHRKWYRRDTVKRGRRSEGFPDIFELKWICLWCSELMGRGISVNGRTNASADLPREKEREKEQMKEKKRGGTAQLRFYIYNGPAKKK